MTRVRAYQAEDAPALARIFRAAIHSTATGVYPPETLAAWAAAAGDEAAFASRLARGITRVAHEDEAPIAFGQLDPGDRIAMLYTAPASTRHGWASAICNELESIARTAGTTCLYTEASRAARKFFEKRGFESLCVERVERAGVIIERYRMRRILDTRP